MVCNAAASHPTSAKYASMKQSWKNASISRNNAIMQLHTYSTTPSFLLLVEVRSHSVLLSVHQSTHLDNSKGLRTCSTRPSSSLCCWLRRTATVYCSLRRSSARMSSLVSCL